MASKYAFIVAATYSYTPELTALLNSLDYVGSTADVHIIGIELQEEFLSQLSKLNYTAIHHNVTEAEWQADKGRSETVCRKRYWYAAQIGQNYDAVCILDADLVFCRDPKQFFVIAEKTGYILGPCKEQNKVYEDSHHQFNNEWMITAGYWNDKDLCNCPVFIDARKWKEPLEQSWYWFIAGFPSTNMKCPDMDCMNIAFIKYAGKENIIAMPGNQWLGTNEQHLKPYIRVVTQRDGNIRTESGIEIFSFHGQYYKEKWRTCQLENRHNCANGYLKATECCDDIAKGSMNLLYSRFIQMLDYKIKIEHKDYQI
jgi:lipopolysaccharide biosynthesis glycosyltransferase